MREGLDLEGIVCVELRLHPNLAPVDLRKLLLQAVFGGEHLLRDAKRFRRDLREEWARREGSLSAGPLQMIDPAGRTARLQLAPCKGRGVSVEEVGRFLLHQPRKGGSPEEFGRLWSQLIDLSRRGCIPVDPDALAALSGPAVPARHSPGYGEAAYRIVHDVTHPETAAWIARRLEGR